MKNICALIKWTRSTRAWLPTSGSRQLQGSRSRRSAEKRLWTLCAKRTERRLTEGRLKKGPEEGKKPRLSERRSREGGKRENRERWRPEHAERKKN